LYHQTAHSVNPDYWRGAKPMVFLDLFKTSIHSKEWFEVSWAGPQKSDLIVLLMLLLDGWIHTTPANARFRFQDFATTRSNP
jgi:hypothetical protein